jgi:transposase
LLTIGIDAHKRVHQAVAVDERGHVLANWRGANIPEAWSQLRAWADELDAGARRWGIEGAHTYGHGLAQFLVGAGEHVHDVNPRLTAGERQHARRRGKTDRLDAEAAARVVVRDGMHLPVVILEDEVAVLELLVRERDDVRSEATRVRNQLHALLLRAEPGYELRLKSALKRASAVARLEHYVAPQDGPIARAREAAVRRLAMRLRLLLQQTEGLAKQIRALAAPRYTPLAELPGVDLLTAGALASILGPRSFPDEAALSAYAGVAPLEASSGERVRHRLNRGGDRQLNALVHRIAITQLRVAPAAKAYVSRRRSEGKTWREAVRALKRYIVRAVWRLWQRCHSDPGPAPVPALAT